MKSVALYDPYLNTLGGGEKHILSILKVLEEEGYQINIFWDNNLQKEIENRFSLRYGNKLRFVSNIFKTKTALRALQTLQTLRAFDIFFYVTDGSYFFSSAKKNFVFSMVPSKGLYNQTLLNKIKTSNYKFITNSKFTQNWLNNWGVKSKVIYPFISQDFINLKIKSLQKENIILSVGRFYGHLHSKKQSILINLFKKIKQSHGLYKNFRLILAGGLLEEDRSYFKELLSLAKNRTDILFQPNLSHTGILNLYKKARVYIHLTGYGTDENENPEQVEHLGITPLEAMSSGCLTFCYKAGGPKEIIANKINGFLFENEQELSKLLSVVLLDTKLQTRIKSQAKSFVVNNFSYDKFKKRVKEIIL